MTSVETLKVLSAGCCIRGVAMVESSQVWATPAAAVRWSVEAVMRQPVRCVCGSVWVRVGASKDCGALGDSLLALMAPSSILQCSYSLGKAFLSELIWECG